MGKQFGKISTDETVRLFELLEKALNYAAEFTENLSHEAELPSILWHPLYEEKFNFTLALFFHSLGQLEILSSLAASSDPQSAMIEFADSFDPSTCPPETMSEQDKANFLCSLVCTFQNLFAIGRYSKPINELLEEVKGGNDKSLFKAIDIDPTVVSTETAAKRISRAVIEEDAAFLDHLANALKGGFPRKKPDPDYDLLRILSRLLEESLQDMPMDSAELQRLAVDLLGIYPDENQSADSRGNLTRFVTRARKASRTQN